MNHESKREKRKKLIVRIACLALAALRVIGRVYLALSFLFA